MAASSFNSCGAPIHSLTHIRKRSPDVKGASGYIPSCSCCSPMTKSLSARLSTLRLKKLHINRVKRTQRKLSQALH